MRKKHALKDKAHYFIGYTLLHIISEPPPHLVNNNSNITMLQKNKYYLLQMDYLKRPVMHTLKTVRSLLSCICTLCYIGKQYFKQKKYEIVSECK